MKDKSKIVKLDEKGLLISRKGKFGIRDISSFNGTYDIPAIYDEIKNISSYETIIDDEKFIDQCVGCVSLVRDNNKWGAYCYLLNDDTIEKTTINTVFDKIEVFYVDKKNIEIFLKIYLNNKCGILAAYKNKLIVPVSFDKIVSCSNIESKKWQINGIINNEKVIFDGKTFNIVKRMDIDYLNEYSNEKKLINK